MDWNALKNLRQVFLSGEKNSNSYWKSKELLQLYDETFAARIGWKWDSVLKENISNLSLTEPYTLVDWGTGTGIATVKFLSAFKSSLPEKIILIEKSELALTFVKEKIKANWPSILIEGYSKIPPLPKDYVLLVSHVMTEVTLSQLSDLIKTAEGSQVLFWVEPGTSECSKQLALVREKLLPLFSILSPCTHALTCPMLNAENREDWCHHFAKVPQEAFTTEKWKTFSKEMGIDLRSLPTSYLVMSRSKEERKSSHKRLIGRARFYKGYSLLQLCSGKGLENLKVFEKNDKQKIKELKDSPFTYFID